MCIEENMIIKMYSYLRLFLLDPAGEVVHNQQRTKKATSTIPFLLFIKLDSSGILEDYEKMTDRF